MDPYDKICHYLDFPKKSMPVIHNMQVKTNTSKTSKKNDATSMTKKGKQKLPTTVSPPTKNLKFVEVTKSDIQDKQNVSKNVAIVDLLNLWRGPISNRPDAKYRTVEEIIDSIKKVAVRLRSISDFDLVYLVTKSFKFDDQITYQDIPKIILWCFCNSVPEWREKVCLVLANGINDQDKTADDRGCIFMCGEFKMTRNYNVVIVTDDHYEDFRDNRFRDLTLTFYCIKNISEKWETTELTITHQNTFHYKSEFMENEYQVIRPRNLAITQTSESKEITESVKTVKQMEIPQEKYNDITELSELSNIQNNEHTGNQLMVRSTTPCA
jgi:hypothetical protein